LPSGACVGSSFLTDCTFACVMTCWRRLGRCAPRTCTPEAAGDGWKPVVQCQAGGRSTRRVAAFGMLRLASASMMRAIRAVSVERGRDPRQFALLATILKRHSGLTGVASARRRHHRSRHATAFREPAQRRTCGLRRQVRRSRPSETVRRLTAKGHARFRDTMATSRLA
jgi:hypothetical protein